IDAYRTVPIGPEDVGEHELDAASSSDVITFTSPSTVRNYAELPGARPPRGVVACIGPERADAARRAGFRVDIVAAEHSVDGLVKALAAHFGASTGGDPRSPA